MSYITLKIPCCMSLWSQYNMHAHVALSDFRVLGHNDVLLVMLDSHGLSHGLVK